MIPEALESRIPEAIFDHRQQFDVPWVDKWVLPNPFISPLFGLLHSHGAELTDFAFSKEANNIAETHLTVVLRRYQSGIRIGLDNVVYSIVNPDWGSAVQLVEVFDAVSQTLQGVIGTSAKSQESTLSFHISPGRTDFRSATVKLVNPTLAGDANFCGLSLYYPERTVVIDKSQRFDGAAFVRLQRKFAGGVVFSEIAKAIYSDQAQAISMLALEGVG